ncbi:MAG TPA: PVC-type heme-binding CxxCH protein [Gemmataceae bacterium]|nr:PVC-type heme-binding CxxCH protein [Gemmataceae bacterium]
MKSSSCLLAALLLPTFAFAQAPQFDYHQNQSPPKPTPDWVKLVDQGQFDPRLKGYIAPEGIRVEIVAEEPAVINPVGMIFDTDGTLYVLEWKPDVNGWPETPEVITYKDGTKRTIVTMKKKVKDVLKIVQLNPKSGKYDKSEIILEDELPSSILLHDGWIYLSGRGSVRRYRQSQPGGKYDVKEVIAQGFCGFHHHQVSGMTIGNDGWLYLTSGDDDNYVEGSDGSRATVLRTGAVFRCRPDGSHMQAYSMGYRNPYRDLAFDTSFNWFHADNDNEDGSKFTGCRLMHVAEEADFGWRLFSGAHCCKPDHVRGAVYGELPGKMPPMLKTGRGAPAGLLIYNETRFPEEYRGLLYYPDVFRKLIRAYRVAPEGSTFQVAEEFEFLKSDDPLFRPCQMVLGPDGAMYICDWRTDSGGAGRLWGDAQHGRIYRVRWAGTAEEPAIPLRGMDSWVKVVRQSDDDLIKSLAAPDFSDRLAAQRELVHRGDRNRPHLLRLALDQQAPLAARLSAIGALQSFWNDEVKSAFLKLMEDINNDVVRLAADGLSLNGSPGDWEIQKELLKALTVAEPPVRRAVVLAMGRIGAPGAEDVLANVFRHDNGRDVYLSDAIVRALERLGARGMQKLLEIADSGVDRERDHVVEAFLTLRTRAAFEALPILLNSPHLRPEQQVALVKSFANYILDPPIGPDALVQFLTSHVDVASDVKRTGVEMLGLFGPVQNVKVGKLILGLLEDRDPDIRMLAIRTIEQIHLNSAVPVLNARLGDDTWAGFERQAMVKALRVFNDKSSIPPLTAILKDARSSSAEGNALRIEALRSLAQVDPSAAQTFAESFLDEKDMSLQTEAVQVLGTQPSGAKKAAERFLAKKLPRDLLPQVTENLRKHLAKNPELGPILTEVMRGGLLLSLEKEEIEKVQALVKSKGDPIRGRALYLNGKTLACIDCHKLEGVGGNVGPDLTRIWETQSLEKVMESMIDPSKEIKEGYQAYRATTKKGLTYTGLKVVDTPMELVLKESTGKEIRIAKSDLEELEASKQSLMPDNVLSQLSFDQFIDLVAFLRDRKTQESLRGIALEYFVVGPFVGDLRTPFPPEKSPDPKATYSGSKPDEKLAWKVVPVEPNGYLDLRAFFQRDLVAGYALTYVYSPTTQKVRMMIGSTGPIRIWLNDKQAYEFPDRRTAKPDTDKVDVELASGWNSVLVKSAGAPKDHGLYLRFAGGEGLRVSVEKK